VQIFKIINGDLYIFSFKGIGEIYDENLDEAEAMIKSIKYIPKKKGVKVSLAYI